MGKGQHPSAEGPADHRLEIWDQFCERFMRQANAAESWLNLDDLVDQSGDGEQYVVDDDSVIEQQEKRWHCSKCVVRDVLNYVWPEIESLAIKLGVPFQPEIMYLDEN